MIAMSERVIATNKNALRLYHIDEKLEAGIELAGSEVKSIRAGSIALKDGYARLKNDELYLFNVHISEYKNSSIQNHDPKRSRRLLIHRKQIKRLIGKQREKGYTLIPLKVYFKGKWIKVELGLGRGKKKYDKREDIKKREHTIAIQRELKKHRLKKTA
ncbi:MAG: SsrA-binding protein SmpB [Spirochaetes bacterium]|nr:SsrA-binding protein SmpB [Spirochaetota bacterium]